MTLPNTIIIPIVVAIVIVVPIVAVALLNRGKQLKCPQCGHAFKPPLMDEKMSGLGWTFPYMGNIECPHCRTMRSRRDYDKVEQKKSS